MKARARKRVDDDDADPDFEVDQLVTSGDRSAKRQRIANIRELQLREITAKAEAATLKQEQEVQRLKGETGSGGSSMNNSAAALIMMLASQGLEPEKANAYIRALDNESIMRLSVIGSRDSNALLPLIMLGSKQGTSLEEMVKVVGAIIAIAKPAQGNDAMVTKLVTETLPNMYQRVAEAKDVAYTSQIALLRQELADAKPKNPMEYVKDVAEAAAALGMRAGADVSLEVKKLELEDAREVRRIKADRDNTKEIIGTVKDMIEGRAGDLIEKLGSAGAERIRSGKGAKTEGRLSPSAETPQMVMMQCGRCGGTFKVRGDITTVTCPHCETSLSVEGKSPETQREAELPRVPQFGRGGGELTPRWSGPPATEEE